MKGNCGNMFTLKTAFTDSNSTEYNIFKDDFCNVRDDTASKIL